MQSLSSKYNALRQEVVTKLTEIVLANQKPNKYLDDAIALDVELGGARFMGVVGGVLKAVNIMGYIIPIETIAIEHLIGFIEKHEIGQQVPLPVLQQTCCEKYPQAPHPCPKKAELDHDEETLCTCCAHCTDECKGDI